jgi:hypothetical protein
MVVSAAPIMLKRWVTFFLVFILGPWNRRARSSAWDQLYEAPKSGRLRWRMSDKNNNAGWESCCTFDFALLRAASEGNCKLVQLNARAFTQVVYQKSGFIVLRAWTIIKYVQDGFLCA